MLGPAARAAYGDAPVRERNRRPRLATGGGACSSAACCSHECDASADGAIYTADHLHQPWGMPATLLDASPPRPILPGGSRASGSGHHPHGAELRHHRLPALSRGQIAPARTGVHRASALPSPVGHPARRGAADTTLRPPRLPTGASAVSAAAHECAEPRTSRDSADRTGHT